MRKYALLVLALFLLVVAGARPGEPAKKEQEKLQGTWTLVAFTMEGDGDPVALNQEISVEDIYNELLVYTPPTGQSGTALDAFSFKVKDDGGDLDGADTAEDENILTFDVLRVNHAPEGADNTITLTSTSDYIFSAADFGFSDPDDATPDNLDSIFILSLPKTGELQLNSVAVQLGDPVTAAELAAGSFKYVPHAGAFGRPLAQFEFGVMDDGGADDGGGTPYSEGTYFISFERTDNFSGAPIHDLPAAQEVNEDGTLTLSTGNNNALSVTCPDVGSATIEVTLTAINGTITLATTSNLVSVTGDGTDVVTFEGTVADVNTALDGLTFTPTPDYHGPASLEIFTTDLGHGSFNPELTQNDILALTVNSVNDAPEGWDISRPMNEDEEYTFIAPDFGFADTDGNSFLGITILSVPSVGTFKLGATAVSVNDFISIDDIIDGHLTYAAAAEEHGFGYASFTFKVRDDGGDANGGVDDDTTARTVTFDVIAGEPVASDAEYETPHLDELNVLANAGLLTHAADADDDTLSVFAVDGDEGNVDDESTTANGGTLFVNADGSFTYTAALGFAGIDWFSYTVTDGDDHYSTAWVVIDVTSSSPTDITLSNDTIVENQANDATVGTFSATDADTGETFTYTLVEGDGDDDNASFTIDGNTLKAAETFDYEGQTSYSIRVQVADATGMFATIA